MTEKCEVISVEEGHDVQRVTEIMCVTFGARCVFAKETMSAFKKLAREIDETRSSRDRAGWSSRHRGACLGDAH